MRKFLSCPAIKAKQLYEIQNMVDEVKNMNLHKNQRSNRSNTFQDINRYIALFTFCSSITHNILYTIYNNCNIFNIINDNTIIHIIPNTSWNGQFIHDGHGLVQGGSILYYLLMIPSGKRFLHDRITHVSPSNENVTVDSSGLISHIRFTINLKIFASPRGRTVFDWLLCKSPKLWPSAVLITRLIINSYNKDHNVNNHSGQRTFRFLILDLLSKIESPLIYG